MKIGIVGAGGVGGYLAHRLAEAGELVYLVARGAHLEAIRERGICLKTKEGLSCARPAAVSDNPADFGETMDAVLFCVKGYDLKEAARKAAPMVGSDTLLVPLGNGVGNAEVIAKVYPGHAVANGAVYIVSHVAEPGVVALVGRGALVVMGMAKSDASPKPKALAEALKKAGVKVVVSEDITTDVWKKYLLIAAMGTLTSCYDVPMGVILQKHRGELEEAFREIIAVGAAEGAALGEEDLEMVRRQLERVPHDAPTSMWLDFKAGRKTELEQLTGYIVRKGAEHGIDVPTMHRCYEILKAHHS
ncbi:ketopantoate reductase family protein [Hydrogenimonas urashimensis]|uniref:ketopantoate reductase family protein n=1 Tax=Hydrogenimonas urashimensis TaxID=2740515 RepID=UPI001916C038|nr:2-dehydropantoate 2-reductase [Hydrogenimonas urashimensis]